MAKYNLQKRLALGALLVGAPPKGSNWGTTGSGNVENFPQYFPGQGGTKKGGYHHGAAFSPPIKQTYNV